MTRMDDGHRCTSTLTHRVWFLNKHILVGNGQTANSNKSVLVAIIMTWVILFLKLKISQTVDSIETNVPSISCLKVLYDVMHLTSLPMQRCCPTPFSHLWWRLILQALQRRPCFAVFPARNTTCLAVVPNTCTEKRQRVQVCHVKSWTWMEFFSKQQIAHKKGEEMEKYCSERHLIHLFIVFTHLFLARVSGVIPCMQWGKPVKWHVVVLTGTKFNKSQHMMCTSAKPCQPNWL